MGRARAVLPARTGVGPKLVSAAVFALAVFVAPACSDDAEPSDPDAVDSADASLDVGSSNTDVEGRNEGELLALPDGAFIEGHPWVRIAGKWHKKHPSVAAIQLISEKRAAGIVVHVAVELAAPATVDAIAAFTRIVGRANKISGWVSNGFQSWSQSGVVALSGGKPDKVVAEELAKKGDGETLRLGDASSWFYTAMPYGDGELAFGVVEAKRWKDSVLVRRESNDVAIRLVSGWTGEQVRGDKGDKILGDPWYIGTDGFSGYVDQIKARHTQQDLPPSEAGWNSWYELWDGVDDKAVRENAAIAKTMLAAPVAKAYKANSAKAHPLRIVVDDGWQKKWGDWQPNNKFPSGLDGLAKDLGNQGFVVGVWLAPLLAEEGSEVFQKHPEWFVKGPTFPHLKIGKMHVLDPTHPGAAKHLHDVIATIVGWGYSLLKIDFLFAGTWEGQRAQPVTGIEAYHRALAIIREAAGDKTLLLGVGAPAFPTIEYVDLWRVGGDIAVEPFVDPHFAFVASQLRMLNARWALCRRVLCDPDPLMLRAMPKIDVETGAWTVAIAGGGLFLSDDLRKLDPARKTWGMGADQVKAMMSAKVSVPTTTFPAMPPATLASATFDYLQKKDRHVVARVWTLPDDRRVGFNVAGKDTTIDGSKFAKHEAKLLGNK